MNSARKTDGWVLCPSKSFPGKYYYFNVTTGETAWSLNENERNLLKTPLIQKDKNSYPEPSGPPMEDTPSIFTQHSYRNVNNANRNMFVDVRTYQQPVFGQPAIMVPDIQIKVPVIIGSEFQSCAPTFASLNQSGCLPIDEAKMSFQKNLMEVDRELFIPTSFTPLSRRFVNYEPFNNAERSQRYYNYEEPVTQVEHSTSRYANYEEPANKAEQLTPRFVNYEKPVTEIEHSKSRYVNYEEPVTKIEHPMSRCVNYEVRANNVEQLTPRFVNDEERAYKVEQSTVRYVNYEEPVNEIEHSTSKYANYEKPANKAEQLTPRFVNYEESVTKVEHPMLYVNYEKPVDEIDQSTSRYVNYEEPVNKVEHSTSRYYVNYEEPANKVEHSKSRYVNYKECASKVEQLTPRFVNYEESVNKVEQTSRYVHYEEPVTQVEHSTLKYVNYEKPVNEIEHSTSRYVNYEEPVNKVEHSKSRYVNYEERANKVEQLTPRFIIYEEPANKVEQLTPRFVNYEEPVNEIKQSTSRYVNYEDPVKKVEHSTSRYVNYEECANKVEQLTPRIVNYEEPVNKVEHSKSRYVNYEEHLKKVNEQERPKCDMTPTKAIKSLFIESPKLKCDTSTPLKLSTPLFPHDQSTIDNSRQLNNTDSNQTKSVIHKPILNLVPKTGKDSNIFSKDVSYVSKPGLSNIFAERLRIFAKTPLQGSLYTDPKVPKEREINIFQSKQDLLSTNKKNKPNERFQNSSFITEKPTLFENKQTDPENNNIQSDDKIAMKYNTWHTEIFKQIPALSQRNMMDIETNEESELLKHLGENDLRRILMSKKRKVVDNVKLVAAKKIRTTKDGNQTPSAPKKQVTFDLMPEKFSDVMSSEDSTHDANFTVNKEIIQKLRLLASPSKRANPWYIIIDTQVLLEEFELLEHFIKEDPKCHIYIPSHVMADTINLSKSDSAERHSVTLARHLMRRLWKPHAQIIAPKSSEDMANMTTEDAILESCILATQEHSLVILVTNDENLQVKAKQLKIHCLNVQQIKDGGFEKPEVSFDVKNFMISVPNIHEQSIDCEIPTHVYKMKLFESDRENNNNLSSRDRNCSTELSPNIIADKPECDNSSQIQKPFQIQKKQTEIPATPNKDNQNIDISNRTESCFFKNVKNQQEVKENSPERNILSTYFQNKDKKSDQSLASLFQQAKENALKKKRERLSLSESDVTVSKQPKNSIELDGIEKIETLPNQKKPSIFENLKLDRTPVSEFENYKNIKVQFNNSFFETEQSTKVLAMTPSHLSVNNDKKKTNFDHRKCENTRVRLDNSIFEDLPTKDTPIAPTFTTEKYKNPTKPYISTTGQKYTEDLTQPSVFGAGTYNNQDVPLKPSIFGANKNNNNVDSSKPSIFRMRQYDNQDQPSVSATKKYNSTENLSKPSIFETEQYKNQHVLLKPSFSATKKYKSTENLSKSIFGTNENNNNEHSAILNTHKMDLEINQSKSNKDRSQPSIFHTEKYENNEIQQPPIFETGKITTDRLQPSIFKPDEIQVATDTKDVLEEFLKEILEKNNITEKRIEDRKEEVMCSLKQILEEFLTEILKNSSIQTSPPPWSLPEVLQYTDKLYGSHTTIKSALEFMSSVFDAKGGDRRSVLNASDEISAGDVVNFVGCGYLLLDCLKKILPNFEAFTDAEDSLNKVLQNDPNSIEEKVIKTSMISRNVESYEERSHRRNFVKKRSDVINYLKKHYSAWADYDGTLNTTQTPSWGQSNKDVTIVRTFGKNLNLLNINKCKRMTMKANDSEINRDNLEHMKVGSKNVQICDVENNNDMTGPIVKHVEEIKTSAPNKVPEQNIPTTADKSKTIDNIRSKNMKEQLAELKLKEVEILKLDQQKGSDDPDKSDFKKAGPKIIRTFEKFKLNRGYTGKSDENKQNLEGSKSLNTQNNNENTQIKNDTKNTTPFYNFKLTKHVKDFKIPKIVEMPEHQEKQHDLDLQNVFKNTQIENDFKKTDIKIIRQIDNIKSTKELKDSTIHKIVENVQNTEMKTHDSTQSITKNELTKTDFNKTGPKIIRTFKNTCLNQECSKIVGNIQNHDEKKRKDIQDFVAIEKNDFKKAEIMRPFNNFEVTKEVKHNETVENTQKAVGQKPKNVQNIGESIEKGDLKKTEPRIVRLFSNNKLNQQVKDNNVSELKNKTDFDLDFPTKGHTFGISENAGPKVIRNVKLLQEYEEKLIGKRLSLDYDCSENIDVYDLTQSNNHLDATNDSSFKTEPNGFNGNSIATYNVSSSNILDKCVTSTYATNDFMNYIQNRGKIEKEEDRKGLNDATNDIYNTQQGNNAKNDAKNDFKNYTQNREHKKEENAALHRITQHGENRNDNNYAINDVRNLNKSRDNKNDVTNDFASFVTCQATNDNSLNDLESCLTTISSGGFTLSEDHSKANANKNDSGAINDESVHKNDTTHDSGLGNDSQVYLIVSFLTELSKTSKLAEEFIKASINEIKDKHLLDNKRQKIYEKASNVYKSVAKIIDSLKSIILRECCSATSLSAALARATNDDKMHDYRLVVSIYLDRAQKLMRDLKMLLSESATVSHIDNIESFRSSSDRYFSVFEKQ